MAVLRAFPRGSVAIVLSALIVAAAILANTYYTAQSNSHDTTYYACLYAGALTQINTTAPPANCGRGVPVQWGGIVDVDDLGEDVQLALRCGEFPHWDVDWSGCDLHGANLQDAQLRRADLTGADLSLAILTDASLFQGTLVDAIFTSAYMPGVEMRESSATNAHFPNAVMTGADLAFADFTGAEFLNTNLISADLEGANLTDATLLNADLTNADLTGTTFCNTTMPDGSINNTGCP